VLDLTWLGLLVVAVGVVLATGSESLVLFVAVWAGSGALAGLLAPLPYRHSRISLGLGWLRETWPFSWRYALSFASMQTAALGVSVAIVGIAGSRALGAVRGALLLLGPFTQLQAAAIAAGVAEVSRMKAGTAAVARHVRRTTTLTAGVAVANAVVLLLLPDALGRLVLGATWAPTERLLWPACVQMVMLGLIGGVRSALLGLKAVRATTTLDVVGTAVTLGLTVVGAFVDGALGAFWFLAVGQAVVAIMWWATYLGRHQRPLTETQRSEQVPC
jgi:O-antigen/teichoic acid export membrane protein